VKMEEETTKRPCFDYKWTIQQSFNTTSINKSSCS
jgi:hypothetical protein